MTDTHDTNLPDKAVELEEDKKTAEVSEPATTETSAEATLTDKPAESVQKLTKEEILNKLKEIATDVENAAKSEIDSLKQAFYKLHNSEQEAAKKLFVENGGIIEEFVPQPYYQVFESKLGFLPNLSIIDLLFNMGPESLLVLSGERYTNG